MPSLKLSNTSLKRLEELLATSERMHANLANDRRKQAAANKNVTGGLSTTSTLQQRRISSVRINSVAAHIKINKRLNALLKQIKKLSAPRLIKASKGLLRAIGLLAKLMKSPAAAAKIGGVKKPQKTVTVIQANVNKASSPEAKSSRLPLFANSRKKAKAVQVQAAKSRQAEQYNAAQQQVAAHRAQQHKQ